jgi:hypothetical protein
LQELLYLDPEQRLMKLLSSICVQNIYIETPATFSQDANRAMIVENAGNQTANQKKAVKVRSTYLEQPQFRFKQNGKFELFLSLSIRTSNAYSKLKAHFKNV